MPHGIFIKNHVQLQQLLARARMISATKTAERLERQINQFNSQLDNQTEPA
jgi:hypothetical protein